MDINEAIKIRMVELVEERDVSLNEIIKRSGINQSTISEFMSGRSQFPRIDTIQKFCCGCDITLGEFFTSKHFMII